jgi:hypothetical protein
MPGAAQTPNGFAQGIGPITKIEKPELRSGIRFQIAKSERGSSGQVLLPRGSKPSGDSILFVGKKGGSVSIIIEWVGKTAKRAFSERATHPANPGQHLVSAGPWIGAYVEHMWSDNIRMGRLYGIYSAEVAYSMMISWPARDQAAKKDAEMLARFVIWSFKLNSNRT